MDDASNPTPTPPFKAKSLNPEPPLPQASVIVVGNEKGGAGKSTVAIHVAVALMQEGARIAVCDLDTRQQTSAHFFANRRAWTSDQGVDIVHPVETVTLPDESAVPAMLERPVDFVIFDTPGADTPLSRIAHEAADLIITPMNDSFVDFDMLGVLDPVTLNVLRPSLYAETVWNARKRRALTRGGSIDWVVLRNRVATAGARNRRRVDDRLAALARRVGFRSVAGLRERVIYRELFPYGLTVMDLSPAVRPVQVTLAHLAARQEMRVLLADLDLVEEAGEPPPRAPAG
jgi:chromosome partitioning protein